MLIYLAVKQLGILSFYTLPTTSMEPSYAMGKLIMVSSLVQPECNGVVAYRATSPAIPRVRPAEEGIYIGRIVAQGGDQVELRDGYVYRNDQLADEGLRLKFLYEISAEARAENAERIRLLKPEDTVPVHGKGMLLFLDEQEKQAFRGHEHFVQIDPQLNLDAAYPANAWIADDWTMNNYGPVAVPPDHFFILGDNRNNSEDSRLRGFVPEEEVVGVVLN